MNHDGIQRIIDGMDLNDLRRYSRELIKVLKYEYDCGRIEDFSLIHRATIDQKAEAINRVMKTISADKCQGEEDQYRSASVKTIFVCPKCGSDKQVWRNGITNKIMCHRVGCFKIVKPQMIVINADKPHDCKEMN